jgi:hypothetical protein
MFEPMNPAAPVTNHLFPSLGNWNFAFILIIIFILAPGTTTGWIHSLPRDAAACHRLQYPEALKDGLAILLF